MILKNIKHKSGYLIESKKETLILEGNTGMTVTMPNQDASKLIPKNEDIDIEYQELNINIADVYNDALDKVLNIKDKKITHVEAILALANKWGFLHKPLPLFWQSIFDDDEDAIKADKDRQWTRYDGRREYKDWLLLLNKIIPSSQSFLQQYLKANQNEPSIDDFNHCVMGVEVKYKSLKRTSYEVIPNTLLAALTIFSKSQRERRKKEAVIICAYSKCNNEIIQNIGVGRGRTTCSDSCRTLKARENTKKSK